MRTFSASIFGVAHTFTKALQLVGWYRQKSGGIYGKVCLCLQVSLNLWSAMAATLQSTQLVFSGENYNDISYF